MMRLNNKTIIAFSCLFFLLWANILPAQNVDNDSGSNPLSVKTYFGSPKSLNYTLSGIVKDKSTGEALPFANVMVRNTHIRVATNADGYFTLPKVPSDTSVLIVTYVGYTKTEIYLSPQLPKTNFIIEVLPAANQLTGVSVTAAKEEVVLAKKEEVSVIKMTPRQIEKLPNIGEKDVMRSFQLMPGVSASQESSSGLYVRGGTPDQNLVLFDGFTVYHVDHLYGFFSAFNANAIKDIQLYKGGFESRFGGRLSSVTEITGKDGNQKKFNVGGDISLLSVNAWAEAPIGDKFSSIIAVRRSYKGPVYKKLFEKYSKSSSEPSTLTPQGGGPGGNRFMQQTEPTSYFYDLNGKFTYRPTNKDIITLSIFNGTDKLDNSVDNATTSSFGGPGGGFGGPGGNSNFSNISSSSSDFTKYGNIGSSLKWAHKWSDKIYGTTLISYSNFYSNRDRSSERTTTNSDGDETTIKSGILENNNLKDYSFKSDYQWDISSSSQIQFGVFSTYYNIQYNYSQNDTATIIDKATTAYLAGAYLQNKFRFLDNRLVFTPGIRASYLETTGRYYYEPRASATFSLTDRFSLKAAVGKYYQFANVITREDILSGSKEFWLLSDGKNIPVSSASHYIAGISYESSGYLFSTEAYYKQVKNITEYSLRFNPGAMNPGMMNPGAMTTSYEENFLTGYGYARGIELLAQKKTGNFNGWVSYTLGEAKNHFDAYADTYFPANQDVTHEFKLVMLYNWNRFDFSATWIYATGRPYTAPSGAYSITLLDGSTQEFYTVTAKNELRLPDYHRADVSVNYKLLSSSKSGKSKREIGYIGFSIFNLYNRTNVWYKTYSIDDGSITETNVNYTGMTPNLTLSLKLR
ncbi:MAG: TonB-dependent receptor [Chitinophagaceae bacterium]|nr:TonB-dependent receptor [Chitinophagaceae bacterium]